MRTLASKQNRGLWGLFLIFIAAQIWFSIGTRHLRAAIEEMPPPPTEKAVSVMAFGDREFLFRYLARWLQNVGDGGGRVKPLREMDYDRVVSWLQLLDSLSEDRSNYPGILATHYFGEVKIDPGRVRKIVDYLRVEALRQPADRWEFLVWSSHAAHFPINDPKLLEAIAHDLQSPELYAPNVPAWVRVLPVRLYHLAGNDAAARDAIAHVSPEDNAAVVEMQRKLRDAWMKFQKGGTPIPVPGAPQ